MHRPCQVPPKKGAERQQCVVGLYAGCTAREAEHIWDTEWQLSSRCANTGTEELIREAKELARFAMATINGAHK